MQTFLIVYAALSTAILFFHVLLAFGCVRNLVILNRRSSRQRHVRELSGEVVVAVRNEEKMLPALLSSLQAQTAHDLMFLFIDDRSSDATGRILDDFCADKNGRRLQDRGWENHFLAEIRRTLSVFYREHVGHARFVACKP